METTREIKSLYHTSQAAQKKAKHLMKGGYYATVLKEIQPSGRTLFVVSASKRRKKRKKRR